MLVKNESKYCWCFDGNTGGPQSSIEEAIDDFLNYKENYCWDDKNNVKYLEQEVLDAYVEIGHPYYYVPEVDGERTIWNVVDYDLDDEIAEWSEDYMHDVKKEHIDELSEELTKVFRAWEGKHGYENTAWVVIETKEYRIGDWVCEDKQRKGK